ncbi:amidohydrolase family protein [Aquimonas sp.]|jgi:imidazolonepropionase-like amidohydrolase|uniref:metal-dependent hydrolase family protein n=1 Tax=Aquimonas sp. TaxID=1872588 RepID=UPI0037C19A2A
MSVHHRRAQFGLLAVSLIAALAAQAAPQVMHCGQVFDANSARLLGAHSLVVEDGRITQVSENRVEASSLGSDATAIDLSGHTCLPGLIDMHVHLGSQTSPAAYSEGFRMNPEDYALRSVGYAETTLKAGFTTVRDLGGLQTIALRNAINEGRVVGPRIFAAGKSLATTGGHADPRNGINRELAESLGWPGPEEGVVAGPYEARRAVRQRYKEGSDVIKLTATGGVLSFAKSGDNPQFMEDEIRAVVETARDYGFKVAAHAHGKEGMRRAVAAGVDSIEHGTYMDEDVFALMREKGTWYVPTISAGVFVSEKAREIGYYPEIVRPKAERIGALIQATAGRAQAAGVKIAFGTDAGVFPHGDNAREFVLMVEAGMPANLALQSATRNAAELLGESASLGSLEVGKYADVVAVAGNPLENIALMREVQFVMKAGAVVKAP